MSQFIRQTYELDNEPVLRAINKQIIEPDLGVLQKTENIKLEGEAEKKMVKMMFFHFKNAEYEQLHRENAVQMKKQFEHLRRKMAQRAKQESVQKSMSKKDSECPKLSLGEIIKMNPQKIDLIKKYRSKIRERLQVYRQSEKISKQKQNYHEWNDRNNNSPLKSPIYTKMTYLLQRINHKETKHQSNFTKNIRSYNKLNRSIQHSPNVRQNHYTSTPKILKCEYSLLN